MSLFEVKVPELSESVAQATLLQWKKKVGEPVQQDEILIEIETDKVVLEVPAPSAGILSEILIADAGTVVSGQVIAKIDSEGKAVASSNAPAQATSPQVQQATISAPVSQSAAGIAMPAAAKILAEKNLSTSDVSGTGRDGRVTKNDAMLAKSPVATPTLAPTSAPKLASIPAPIPLGNRPEERVAMSR